MEQARADLEQDIATLKRLVPNLISNPLIWEEAHEIGEELADLAMALLAARPPEPTSLKITIGA